MDAGSQRKLFFKNLDAALWYEDEEGGNGTFAGGGNITQNQQQGNSLLESLHVEGAGELQLPLSSEDFVTLLSVSEQAHYGHGFATVLNPAVRRAWQVDASQVTFPRSPNFLSKTIRLLANKAVRALGLDGAALQLEAHLYKLLLYEADVHFSLHRDIEKEPGMFATLVLQLPTQGGFEGGALLVRHGGTTKTFDFSSDSATKFSYTVFYADCEHELQRVTSGKRLCLAFNLVRGRSVSLGTQLGDLKKFSSRLSKVETALLPWRNASSSEEPRSSRDVFPSEKLAIPLQHKYTKKNLSFSGLKGDDRVVAHVLKNCRDNLGRPWLDLYLCIYTWHKTGVAEGSGYSYRRRYDSDDSDEDDRAGHRHTMEDVIDESSECSNWVDINNKTCNLTLEIVEDLEVVVDDEVQEGVFDEDAEPDEVEYEGYTGNAGPTLEYWYHKALIVIWPRKKSIVMACKAGIAGALDILETRLKGDPGTVMMLHEVVSYCERNRATIWSAYSRGSNRHAGSRLLKLCIKGGGLGDVVRVLKLLSEPFKLDGYGSVCTIGFADADTSTAIASAVHTHGWVDCGPFVLNMLGKEQVMEQGRYFAHLALELHKLGCEDAGLLVAKRTLELSFVVASPLKQLQCEMIVSMGKLICFKECMSKVGLKFVERLEQVSTDVLCSLVTQVFATFSKEVTQESSSTEGGVSGAVLFRRICQIATTRNFHRPTMLESHVVELVRTFSLLGDEQLLNNLIQALLDQSRMHKQQHLLKKLLGSDAIWTDLSGTAIGRSRLKLLADERILALSQLQPPFTWCMPFAKFPRHPAVEAFLRGQTESLTYTGVNDSKHATNFARKYFGHGGYQDGYSATGRAGYASCVITKTRTAFQHQLAQWKREQQEELPRLRQRLEQSKNATTAGSGSVSDSGRIEVVVLSPDASDERQKRKVEKTEYIDLSLDDE